MSEYMAPAEGWKPEKKEEGCTVNVYVNCGKEERKPCYGKYEKYEKKDCDCKVNVIVNCGDCKKWDGCEKKSDGCTVNVIINCDDDKKEPRAE